MDTNKDKRNRLNIFIRKFINTLFLLKLGNLLCKHIWWIIVSYTQNSSSGFNVITIEIYVMYYNLNQTD